MARAVGVSRSVGVSLPLTICHLATSPILIATTQVASNSNA